MARRAVTPRTRRRAPMSPPPTPAARPPPLPRLPFLRALSSSASLVGASRASRLAGPSRCIVPPWAPRRFHAWQRGSRTTPARHVAAAGVRSEGTTIAAKCPCEKDSPPDAALAVRRPRRPARPSRPRPCQPRVFPTGPPPASAILRGLACPFLQEGVNACAGANGHFWVLSISRQVLQVLSASFAGKRRADRRPQNLRTNLRNLPAGFARLRLAGFASFLACF